MEISYTEIHSIYLFIFSLGLSLGLGAVVLGNMLIFTAAKDRKISRDEYAMIKDSRTVEWFGLLLYAFAGVGLFTLAYESMLQLGIFYASMTIATVLISNTLFFQYYYLPKIQRQSQEGTPFLYGYILVSGVVSVVSWLFLVLHHSMHRASTGYFAFMIIYVIAIFLGLAMLRIAKKDILEHQDRLILTRATLASGLLVPWFLIVAFMFGANPSLLSIDKVSVDTAKGVSDDSSYSVADVSLHNNPEDCWLIIDDLVFNATEAARMHPAMFNCGENASVNYHKNHGEKISEKMMKFHIGALNEREGITKVDSPLKKNETLAPYRELYVDAGSWKPEDLMAIVEKTPEKLLFIDGVTHKEVARIHDVGFQPHTSVFSSDARFMYIIARDGWLTKIDLRTLEPIKSVNVGKNSRGTALTDDGKYLAIGNYEPGNVVIVDPDSMKTLATIDLVGELGGKEIVSRAGALVEDGEKVIVALKDLNSVWVIDTSKSGFPVTEKYWNIGDGKTPLHDAFLTPDGKFFIVASMGSNTVWVLDTETWKPVGEIKTGETPHTGPGATWGNNIYIPALGEGLITVVDMKTWKPIKYIKTAGPGLFVRAFNEDPEYPYVWAETAFGDHQDEIYVIDARSNEIVKTLIPVKGKSSWHPEFTNNGQYVYVVSQTANEVEVYDAHTFEIVKRIVSETPSAVSNIGNRIDELGL